MSQDLHEIANGMTAKMRCALMTGSASGYTCIGKTVTIKALIRRGLIASDRRWTKLGWAIVLWIVATEPGWNSAHFPTPRDVHATAILENQERQDRRNSEYWEHATDSMSRVPAF